MSHTVIDHYANFNMLIQHSYCFTVAASKETNTLNPNQQFLNYKVPDILIEHVTEDRHCLIFSRHIIKINYGI